MKKITNYLVIAVFAITIAPFVTSCSKDATTCGTGFTPVVRTDPNTGRTYTDCQPATSIPSGDKLWKLWGNTITATKAYSVDNGGDIALNPNDGNMYNNLPQSNWNFIMCVDPNGVRQPVLISDDDLRTMRMQAIWDSALGFFKSANTGKQFYFDAVYTTYAVGCSQMGSLDYTDSDGLKHYHSGGITIFYQVAAVSFN